jgi:hypothetical protein
LYGWHPLTIPLLEITRRMATGAERLAGLARTVGMICAGRAASTTRPPTRAQRIGGGGILGDGLPRFVHNRLRLSNILAKREGKPLAMLPCVET